MTREHRGTVADTASGAATGTAADVPPPVASTASMTAPASPPALRSASRRRLVLGAVLAVGGFFLPTLVGGGQRAYDTLVLIAIFAIMSYGVDLLLSYLGEVSLGHTLFWAAGAYTGALLAAKAGVPTPLTLPAALLVAAALAAVLGVFTLRTREFVFSLVTYAAAVIGLKIVSDAKIFGGTDGITGIPLLSLPVFGGDYSVYSNRDMWPIAYVCLLAVVWLVARFRGSRLGVKALMTQMNTDFAEACGVNTRRVRLAVFVMSAPIAGLAGWLYTFQRSYVSPDLFDAYFLLVMLTAVILAGRRVLLGPLVGVSLIVVQQQLLSFGGNGDKIVLGTVLAALLLLRPQGLGGLFNEVGRRLRRESSPAEVEAETGSGQRGSTAGPLEPDPRDNGK